MLNRIGHDNSSKTGWHLDRVKIKIDESSEKYLFNSNSWFSRFEDDGAIERFLYEDGVDIVEDNKRRTRMNQQTFFLHKKKINFILLVTASRENRGLDVIKYYIQTVTSNLPNASTSANVFIQFIGSKNLMTGKSLSLSL